MSETKNDVKNKSPAAAAKEEQRQKTTTATSTSKGETTTTTPSTPWRPEAALENRDTQQGSLAVVGYFCMAGKG